MRNALLAAVVGAAMIVGASSASAATYINFKSPDSDGSISGVFGNDGGIAKGNFTNTFNFTWPVLGISSGAISSSFTSKANDLNFTSVTLNGVAFASVIGGSGLPEFRFLTNLPVSGRPAAAGGERLQPGQVGDLQRYAVLQPGRGSRTGDLGADDRRVRRDRGYAPRPSARLGARLESNDAHPEHAAGPSPAACFVRRSVRPDRSRSSRSALVCAKPLPRRGSRRPTSVAARSHPHWAGCSQNRPGLGPAERAVA